MAIKGILFDKDGTLIDLDGTWVPVYRQFLQDAFSMSRDEAEHKMEGAGFDRTNGRFRSNSVLAGGTTKQLVEHWWPMAPAAEQDRLVHVIDVECAPMARSHLKPLLPVAEVLAPLRRRGLVLGVGTNDSHFSALSQLAHLGLSDYFDAVIGADTVARPKPSGDMIRRFAELTSLQPDEVAMVGDTLHDMEEARNGAAGLAIGVLSGSADQQQLAPWAHHIIADIRHLEACLDVL
jgi:phosphoglycolate phosphatase